MSKVRGLSIEPHSCIDLLTLGAHAHSEAYCSCRVCMYVCVYVYVSCVYAYVSCVYVCVCVCMCDHS